MATAIAAAHPGVNAANVPGGKGDFIVKVDGKEVWNKMSHPEQRFPEHDEILAQLSSSS